MLLRTRERGRQARFEARRVDRANMPLHDEPQRVRQDLCGPLAVAPAIAANEGYDEIEQVLNADDFLRAYIEELLPDVPEGRLEPSRVFDRVTNRRCSGWVPGDERTEVIEVMMEFGASRECERVLEERRPSGGEQSLRGVRGRCGLVGLRLEQVVEG